MVDLQAWRGVAGPGRHGGSGGSLLQPAGQLQETGLQALSCFCVRVEAAGDPAGQGVGLGLASPFLDTGVPSLLMLQLLGAEAHPPGPGAMPGPHRGPWEGRRAPGPNLFSRHAVSLGH